ncbi:hypothetical protein WJ07_25025 [Burkholderia vietnamiensis]|nr:hypothetical protein WJ07_25025 [Burkholderia vietnamiensis]
MRRDFNFHTLRLEPMGDRFITITSNIPIFDTLEISQRPTIHFAIFKKPASVFFAIEKFHQQ